MRRREAIAGILAAVGGSAAGCREAKPSVTNSGGPPTLDDVRRDAQAVGVELSDAELKADPRVRRRFREDSRSGVQSSSSRAPAEAWATNIRSAEGCGKSARRLVRNGVHQRRAHRAVSR